MTLVLVATLLVAPVRMTILPKIGMAPRTVAITIQLDENIDHRAWCLDVVSDTGYFSSSCRNTVDFFTRKFRYNDLPAGNYTVEFRAIRDDGKVDKVGDTMCFSGMNTNCE